MKKHKTKSDMLLNSEHNTVLASQMVSAAAWSLIISLPLHPWLPSSHLSVNIHLSLKWTKEQQTTIETV